MVHEKSLDTSETKVGKARTVDEQSVDTLRTISDQLLGDYRLRNTNL